MSCVFENGVSITYPGISDLGNVDQHFIHALFPKPTVSSGFNDPVCNQQNENYAIAVLMELLEFDRDLLGRILRFEVYNDEFHALTHLPRVVDLSTPGEDRVCLPLYHSSIQRVIVLDKRARLTTWWFLPYTWNENKCNFFFLPTGLKDDLTFSWSDDMTTFDEIPVFEAQALFGIDHNIGLQASLLDALTAAGGQFKQCDTVYKKYILSALELVTLLRNATDMMSLSTSVVKLLVIWDVPSQLATSAWEFINEHCRSLLPGYQAQVFGEPQLKSVAMLCTCFLTVVGIQKLPNQYTINGVLNKFALCGKALGGASNIMDAFKPVFDKVYNWVYELIFGMPPAEGEVEILYKDLEIWFTEISDCLQIHKQDSSRIDFSICRRIEKLYLQGLEFSKRFDLLKIERRHLGPFLQYNTAISRLYNSVVVSGARASTPRTEPVCIHLFGESGVGKSGLVYLIGQDLCAMEDLEDKFMDEIYFRNIEQDFFDGYKGQLITVYDDFGSKRDTTSNPNGEFMEIIRSMNIAPWPLHMASLEEKSRTFFRSRALVLTSNKQNYNVDSITNMDAFLRRIDIQAEVSVAQEYRMPGKFRLNVDHPDLNGDPLSTKIYRFRLCDPTSSFARSSQEYTYEQFIGYVKRKYADAFLKSELKVKSLKARAVLLKKVKEAEKFSAQVNTGNRLVSLDRIIFPAVWANVHHNQRYNIPYNGEAFIKALEELAIDKSNYYDFLFDAADLSEKLQIDVTSFVDVDDSLVDLEPLLCEKDWIGSVKVKTRLINSVKSRFLQLKEVLMESYKLLQERSKLFMMFGSAVGTIIAVYSLRKWFQGDTSGDIVERVFVPESREIEKGKPKSFISESREIEKQKPRSFKTESRELEKITSRKFVSENRIVAQATTDQNAQDVKRIIAGNSYIVFTKKNGEWVKVVNGLFVSGNLLLMVAHAEEFLHEECKLGNTFVTDGLYFLKSQCEFITLKNSEGEPVDAMIVKLPGNVPQHKCLLKQFMETQDLSRFNSVKGILYVNRHTLVKGGAFFSNEIFHLDPIRAIDQQTYSLTTPDKKYKDINIRRGYRYTAHTSDGDCSAPVIAYSTALQRKILGIHVAGSKSTASALAQLITQKMLNEAIQNCGYRAQISFDLATINVKEELEPNLPDGDFIPIGKLDVAIPAAVRTELRKSPLYGKIKEPTTAPAVLKPTMVDGVLVNPLVKGLEKCGVSCPLIDNELLERCRVSLLSQLKDNKCDKSILSLEQSITGIPGDDFLKPINRKSSPGYPWIFSRNGKPGKTKWLGYGENYVLDNPEVIAACEQRLNAAKQGIRIPTLWVDTLKDERRPIEKVKIAKTRVFSAGSMDFILVFRQYFLTFNANMMRRRIGNGSAVGINPYSIDWHNLALHLQKKGRKVFAGDFSNFDGTLHPDILWACLELINDWYDDGAENRLVRAVLFSDIVNSLHVYEDNVYQWTHSQPSGNPLTAILNTLYNLIAMRYVFVECTGLSLIDFDKHVSMIAFGDDNAVNISEEISVMFNQITVSEAFKKIGMKYTDESKTGELVEFRHLSEISFLKRSFRKCSTLYRYVGPLELDVVLEMPMWIRSDLDQEERCGTTVEKAYGELAIHGKEIFSKWSTIIDALAQELLHDPPVLYHYLDYVGRDLEKF